VGSVSGVDLAQWLGDQLDEDERIAREAPMEIGQTGDGGGVPADAPARWVASHHLVMREPLADDEEIRIVTDCAAFGGSSAAVHIAAWGPARVLREIDAKREILARYEFACGQAVQSQTEAERETWVQVAGALQSCVLLLAAVHEDRQGYAEAVASAE
jgi:uncharacterized protein DUF6221